MRGGACAHGEGAAGAAWGQWVPGARRRVRIRPLPLTTHARTPRRVFLRAVGACPWSKALWCDGLAALNREAPPRELSGYLEVSVCGVGGGWVGGA